MNKNNRTTIAHNTLEIIREGFYLRDGQRIEVAEAIKASHEGTYTIAPQEWGNLLAKSDKIEQNHSTFSEVKNCTTLQAIRDEAGKGLKVGLLNFASAKNPGGGFLGGAMAQEESLARASSLYDSLTKDISMYGHNKSQSSFIYSDYMIFSPKVAFWFDDAGNPLEFPLLSDVITSPAPNKGAMLQHNRKDELSKINAAFRSRMEMVLALAKLEGVECLILGAWGCGVFRNEPEEVAQLFKEALNTKFKGAFKKIVFAVYDTSEKKAVFNAFNNIFS